MEMTYEQLLDEEIEFLQKHWDKIHKWQPVPINTLNDVAMRIAHLVERRKSFCKRSDFLPDVASREQSERATGNEGVARATLPARPSANADGLLPCPFCYEEKELFVGGNMYSRLLNVVCENCGAKGSTAVDRNVAIEKWNAHAR